MRTVQLPPELAEASRQRPLLVVFLRHAGCPFCRQALDDLRQAREEIERLGTEIVLVHMMTDAEEARAFFGQYGLDDVRSVADPEQQLYREFQLPQGRWTQYLGPRVWWQGFVCTIVERHKPGRPQGDLSQLSGCFLVRDSQIVKEYRHKTSADRPDYVELARSPAAAGTEGEGD